MNYAAQFARGAETMLVDMPPQPILDHFRYAIGLLFWRLDRRFAFFDAARGYPGLRTRLINFQISVVPRAAQICLP